MTYLLDQLANGFSLGCVYALIALGFAMVFGVLRFLNFAHSEVFTTGSFIGYFALKWLLSNDLTSPMAVALSMLLAAVGSGCLAVAIERVAYRPLRDYPGVTALLTSIGISVALQNLGIYFLSAHTRGYPRVEISLEPRVFAIVVLAGSIAFLYTLVHRTPIGTQMRAVAEDRNISALMGIDPNRVIILVFFIGGFFAGVGGVVWGLVYGTVHPQMGFYPGLKAFIIAVVGSIGNLSGTFITAVLLGIVESLLSAYLPSTFSAYRDPLVLGLLLIALVLRPTGIFGRISPLKV